MLTRTPKVSTPSHDTIGPRKRARTRADLGTPFARPRGHVLRLRLSLGTIASPLTHFAWLRHPHPQSLHPRARPVPPPPHTHPRARAWHSRPKCRVAPRQQRATHILELLGRLHRLVCAGGHQTHARLHLVEHAQHARGVRARHGRGRHKPRPCARGRMWAARLCARSPARPAALACSSSTIQREAPRHASAPRAHPRPSPLARGGARAARARSRMRGPAPPTRARRVRFWPMWAPLRRAVPRAHAETHPAGTPGAAHARGYVTPSCAIHIHFTRPWVFYISDREGV